MPPAGYGPLPSGALPGPSPFLPNPYQAGAWPAGAGLYGPGGVYVELRTSTPAVRIDRVLSEGITIPVCVAPCKRVLPRDGVYIITGDGVRATSRFVLPDNRNRVVFDVQAGSTNQTLGGAILMGGGLLVGYVGLLVLAASAIASDAPDSGANNDLHHGKTVGGDHAGGRGRRCGRRAVSRPELAYHGVE